MKSESVIVKRRVHSEKIIYKTVAKMLSQKSNQALPLKSFNNANRHCQLFEYRTLGIYSEIKRYHDDKANKQRWAVRK
jgi:hypothetical protein